MKCAVYVMRDGEWLVKEVYDDVRQATRYAQHLLIVDGERMVQLVPQED